MVAVTNRSNIYRKIDKKEKWLTYRETETKGK